MHVTDLRVEHRNVGDTLGIGAARPRLSWRTDTDASNWNQAAYAITAIDAATDEVVWSSGEVSSANSYLVAWGGPALASRTRIRWQVRVLGSDELDATSEWSEFELGLLDDTDWVANWIVADAIEPADPTQPVASLRREFAAPDDIVDARLHVSALGVYEVEINGTRVGDHVLAPGWTTYDHRVRVETHDVTDLVQAGTNAIGVTLADGWFGERFGVGPAEPERLYGDEGAVIAQLELVDAAGRRHTVSTDETWRSARSAVISSGIYAGETYDARAERPGWSQPGHDERDWNGVHRLDRGTETLIARVGPAIRRTEEIAPVAITTSSSGRTIVDFGQNLTGWIRLRVDGAEGTTITLRHAEILQDGELWTENLGRATATDRLTLRGDGPIEWEPRFTFHGFRYAEIDGWPGEVCTDDVRAIVVHSDLHRTGWFSCSHDQINQLHANVVWGMRGNFLDVPTDCPQRAERLGWTGDINVFAPTASFLFDVDGFLASWLVDLAADQRDDGFVPHVVPDIGVNPLPCAVWGDAAVVVPWVMYERFGDLDVLAQQYPSMRAWVEYLIDLAGPRRHWSRGFQYGDWVDPASPPEKPWAARTDPHLVSQAAFCHSLDLVARTAELLGHTDDVARFRGIAVEAREVFAREYVTPNGRLASDAQTAYALAICWDLLADDAQRANAGRRLAFLVFSEGFCIGTGFVGTPIVCDALCATGNADVAYALLEQTESPSWLAPLALGATTIWERWDSLRPDGTPNPGSMNSFNHYALGAIADWLHRTVAGLAPGAPGYRTLDVTVRPGGSITSASAEHDTPYGRAAVRWTLDAGHLDVEVVVPPNTTATVRLVDEAPVEVGSGTHHWAIPAP